MHSFSGNVAPSTAADSSVSPSSSTESFLPARKANIEVASQSPVMRVTPTESGPTCLTDAVLSTALKSKVWCWW